MLNSSSEQRLEKLSDRIDYRFNDPSIKLYFMLKMHFYFENPVACLAGEILVFEAFGRINNQVLAEHSCSRTCL